MCGIFGLVAASGFRESSVEEALADLFLLSESRGKEASGIAGRDERRNRCGQKPNAGE